jgi:hypothetical protein
MVDGRSALNLGGNEIPVSWLVGDFQLAIAEVTAGRFDERAGVFRGVTGTAWLHLPCAVPPLHILGVLDNQDVSRLTQAVEVVADVLHPQTEIAVADAQHLRSYSAWSYGGAAAGGSHGPVVKSMRSASSLVRPHLAAVDR